MDDFDELRPAPENSLSHTMEAEYRGLATVLGIGLLGDLVETAVPIFNLPAVDLTMGQSGGQKESSIRNGRLLKSGKDWTILRRVSIDGRGPGTAYN